MALANKPRKIPRYQEIRDELANEIRRTRPDPDRVFITLEQICERFDTSKITAQRALFELVRGGDVYTKRGCGAFVAQADRKVKSSRLISFIFMSYAASDGALPLVIHGAEEVAREHSYHLTLCNTQGDMEIGRQYLDQLIADEVEGVLFSIPLDEQEGGPVHRAIQHLESHDIPVVLVEKRFLGDIDSYDCVMADNYGGVVKAVQHLYELGHRRIAGIREEGNSGAIERQHGFIGAVLNCGSVYNESMLRVVRELEDTGPVLDYWLSLDHPPTAIVCCHDLFARSMMQAAVARGLRIPEDISIVGFDDLPFSQYLEPKLTTIRQPLEEIGRQSMRLLLRRIGGNTGERQMLRLSTELVVRESTAPPRTDDTQLRARLGTK